MATQQYAALLRGINVGGKNPVPMATLRDEFEAAGFTDVATYIQSGNVLFRSDRPAKELEGAVEHLLEHRVGVPVVVVVRSHRQLRSVVTKAPEGFGDAPETHHSDAVFLKAPLTGAAAMAIVQLRDGVDRAWAGSGVLYFERLSAERTKSRMNKIMGHPEYQQMTIRSWSTTTKLLAMLDERATR